jgi:putative transposase
MKEVIGSYRYFYNKGIEYLNSLEKGFFEVNSKSKKNANFIRYEGQYIKVETGGTHCYGIIPKYDYNGKQMSLTGFQTIRNVLKQHIPSWFKQLPIHLIDQASRECASNFKSIIERRKLDHKKFQMRFKSKKNSVMETVNMEASSLSSKGKIYSGVFKDFDSRVYTKEPLNFNNNKQEYKIIYDRNTHEYFISLLLNNKVHPNLCDENKWCSIDPGEKVFSTVYNPYDREILFLGCNERKSFFDFTIDKLQTLYSKNKKKSYRKALQRARNRNRYKQEEMHHKIANYLCSNFKHIIIPSYSVKTMNLKSAVNRSVRNLGYYKFLMFLKHKCYEKNVKIYIVDESYTTQSCCSCGSLNKPNDRNYVCSECGIEIHRDANGAVNIGLKHIH